MVENKQQKYQCVFDAFSKWLKDSKSQDEEEQQEKLCCLLSK
jgi:L-methionine (R)-S-oxide reductase